MKEHEAVVAALRARDQSGAETAMRRHIEKAQRTRRHLLRATGMRAHSYPHES